MEIQNDRISSKIGYVEGYLDHLDTIHKASKLVSESQTSITNVGDVSVLCVVKNGEYYLPSFFKHYRAIGITRFVFLDNGSEDNTIAILENEPDVLIVSCDLPYKIYWHHFKRYLFEYYGKNRWNLIVDIDEFFDYPYSSHISLNTLVKYCDENQYDSVIGQMIDLFPNENILDINRSTDFVKSHVYFSVDGIIKKDIESITGDRNDISNLNIKYHMSGWRNDKFGVGEVMLTKHVLVKHNNKVKLVHDHFVLDSRVADFSAVIKHYKFHNGFKKYVDQAVLDGNHFNNSSEYIKYQYVLMENESLNFYTDNNPKYVVAQELLHDSVIEISAGYLKLLEDISVPVEVQCKAYKNSYESAIFNRNWALRKYDEIKTSWSYKVGFFITRIGAPLFSWFNNNKTKAKS